MKKGTFITIEGVEGVGKSTAAKFMQSFLQQHNKKVVLTREPGGTLIAEKIREILLHQENEEIFPETELLLFFASRKQHCEHIINPALAKGKWVVCDRFVDASYAYQGGGRGIDQKWIDMLASLTKLPKPKLTILLDASVEQINSRMKTRAGKDRIEKEQQAFFDRAKNIHLELARANPDRYYVINASLELEKVQQKLKEVLLEYL